MTLPKPTVHYGTDAERQAYGAFAQGELFWTTDSKRLFCGDAALIGGRSVTRPTVVMPWNTTSVCYGPTGSAQNMGANVDSTNNLLLAVPIFLPADTNVKNFYIEVTNYGGATGLKAGLFDNNAGVPGDLRVHFTAAGALAITGTGVKSVANINIRVPAGPYWLVANASANYSAATSGFQYNAFTATGAFTGLPFDATTLDKILYKTASDLYASFPPTMSGISWTNLATNVPGFFCGAGAAE